MASTEQYSRSQYSAGITKCTVHTGRLAEHLAFTSNKAVVVHSDSDPVLSRSVRKLFRIHYCTCGRGTAQSYLSLLPNSLYYGFRVNEKQCSWLVSRQREAAISYWTDLWNAFYSVSQVSLAPWPPIQIFVPRNILGTIRRVGYWM